MSKVSRIVLVVLLALVFIGASAAYAANSAGGEETGTDTTATTTPDVSGTWADPIYRAKVAKAFQSAVHYKRSAHRWSHMRGGHGPWPGIHRPLKMTHSLDYERYRAKLWYKRAQQAHASYLNWTRMWEKRDHEIHRAINAAAKRFGISAEWLRACMASEGGPTYWKWNGGYKWTGSDIPPSGSSGAGGWFQFMKGTFKGNINPARARGRFPSKYAHWHSRVGQAYTTAYMFSIGQQGQWTGSGCRR